MQIRLTFLKNKAENVGTQTVKIIAMLKDEQKEFSTSITVS